MTKQTFRNILAAFLLMFALAVPCFGLSFFVIPVCEEFGFGRGNFTMCYSLMCAGGALAVMFEGRYISRHGVQPVVFASSIVCCIGYWLFALCDSLLMFYMVAFLMGSLSHNCSSLCANVILDKTSLGEHRSTVLGIVMAGSGVGGAIFSLIIPIIIENFGWRWGYRFLGICWMILCLSSLFLLGKDRNLTIGEKAITLHKEAQPQKQTVRSPKLYLMILIGFIIASCCGIQQHLPAILEDMEFPLAQVSIMMSILTAALGLGKVLQGMLYSKIGVPLGSYIMMVIFAISFPMFLSSSTAYTGLILIALGIGTSTTLMPIATRHVLGHRDFATIWSFVATAISVGALVGSPLWGWIHDLTGSYRLALLGTPAFVIATIVAFFFAYKPEKT